MASEPNVYPSTDAPSSYKYVASPGNASSNYQHVPPPGNPAQFQQYQYPPPNPGTYAQYAPAPEIYKIRDWLFWSIGNIFVCCLVGGIIALIFSLVCRSKKRANDLQGARTMSTIALVVNIISTLVGVAVWIIIIVSAVRASQAINNHDYVYYG